MSQIFKASSGGGGGGLTDINVQTGTSPVTPTGGAITFNGATVLAGTNPVRTDGTGPSTMALEVQLSQAIASTNASNVGLAAFNSSQFTVDANGFVSSIGGGGGTVSSMLAFKSSGTANATGDGTTVTVVFDNVTYDQHSDYNNSTGAFTVPVTGTYMVTGNVAIQNPGTTTEWTVFCQSTLYTQFCTSNNAVNVGNTGLIWLPFSALVRLPAADFIEIQVQGSGGTKNNTIFGAGGYFTWLTIALVNQG